MTHSSHRIAIIGAGPGGLTLARLLHGSGHLVTVFERDAGPSSRPQGGTLDLHADSGQLALRRAGLWDGFLAVARYDDQGSRLLDHAGRVLFESADASAGDRPEIDRTALRDLLLASLPDGTVRWDAALRTLAPHGADGWRAAFADGTKAAFDLVVGADGAWSRVRPLLSPYEPQYSGLTFVEFGIDDIDIAHPALSRQVSRGKLDVQGPGRAIIAQRNGNAHVRGYAIFRVPPEWVVERFDADAPSRLRAALLAEFADFADAVTDLFRAAGDRFAVRPIHALPVGHRWTHRRGLTLLGDAAHVMSPFGGEGVNAAMRDAVELADRLRSEADLPAAVAAYEAAMFERVAPVAHASAEAAATALSHDALAQTLAHLRSHEAMAPG